MEFDCGQIGLRELVVAELNASVVGVTHVSRLEPPCKCGPSEFSRALILMISSSGHCTIYSVAKLSSVYSSLSTHN